MSGLVDHPDAARTVDAITGVWREVLGTDAVGPDDDFFGLGGHSMLAVQAALELEESLGRPVPLRLMFANPTPASLAASLLARAE